MKHGGHKCLFYARRLPAGGPPRVQALAPPPGHGGGGSGKINAMNHFPETMRIDKWLWCARFFKTRSLAAEDLAKGRVTVNGVVAKAARDVRTGDTVVLRQGQVPRTVVVRGLSPMRGPASAAQLLYEETPDSLRAREHAAEQRRLSPEPAQSLAEGRPTKRNRRDIERVRDWGTRWSASLDDKG